MVRKATRKKAGRKKKAGRRKAAAPTIDTLLSEAPINADHKRAIADAGRASKALARV